MKVGYARISTTTQIMSLQTDALQKYGCEKIYEEQGSAAKERPIFKECLAFLRPGDTLVVWSLDRLGRSLKDLINIIDDLKVRGIGFVTLKENIDHSTPEGRMMLQMAGMFAEYERVKGIERTKAGIEAARARGRKGGGQWKCDLKQREMIKVLYDSKQYTYGQIAKMNNISKMTVYKYVKELEAKENKSIIIK